MLTVLPLHKGDVDKAFAEADIIIENYYETPMVEHCYLECDICIAVPDPMTGGLTLISPQQAVYATKRCLAPVFGIPHNKLRVLCPVVGGGFGGNHRQTPCHVYQAQDGGCQGRKNNSRRC
ncbi:MAG: molybdopterin cofactor-binding domain-containing protein [Bacillota bacterium]